MREDFEKKADLTHKITGALCILFTILTVVWAGNMLTSSTTVMGYGLGVIIPFILLYGLVKSTLTARDSLIEDDLEEYGLKDKYEASYDAGYKAGYDAGLVAEEGDKLEIVLENIEGVEKGYEDIYVDGYLAGCKDGLYAQTTEDIN